MPALGPIAGFKIAGTAGPGKPTIASARLLFYGSNVVTNTALQLAAGHLTVNGSTPVSVLAPPRVTWMGVEALHTGLAFNRVSWIGLEVLRSVSTRPAQTVLSWIGVEVLHIGAAKTRMSWMGIEVLRSVRAADAGWVSLIVA